MKRRSWLFLSLSVLLTFSMIVAGCGGDDTEVTENNTLIVAQGADAVTLDPHGQNDQPSARVRRQIYETLVYQDENMELQPGLAEDWEVIDEKTFEFKIRQGVKFHNGNELTAHDVAFTFKRLLDPETASPGAFILAMVDPDQIEVLDDYTIKIATKQPFVPLLAHLAHPVTGILNQAAVEEYGEDYGRNPVGTGPFEFVEWRSGESITLKRYEDYWRGPAALEEIVFRNVSEGSTRTIELETGGADVIYDVAPADLSRIENDPNLTLIRRDNFSTTYIGFNMAKEPFDDIRVRQAINYALDMGPIVENVYMGLGQPAKGALGPVVWGANQDVRSYEQDLDKAKQLLTEAGYPDGFSTTLWTNDNQQRMDIAEIVKNQLGQIGIEVSIEILEWGAYLERTGAGEHDMFILGWVTVTGDPDYGLYALFHSSQVGAAGNRTFYVNEEVDELLDLGRSESDEQVRFDAYQRVQEIIAEDAPWVFTWVGEEAVGVRNYVKGFTIHPAGHHALYGVSLDGKR